MNSSDDLIVPVYLNQRFVFDFVASLQGGLAEVTKVTESEKLSGETSAEIGGSFGLSKVLSSLLRIDFSGKASVKGTGEANRTRNEDRIHTPASLFMHLRASLREKGWLQIDSPSLKPTPGCIVEFTTRMQPNPLTLTLDTFVGIAQMEQALADHSNKQSKNKPTTSDNQKMIKQMQVMSLALKSGTTSDLTTASLESTYRCIITLENQYLNDPSMADLADGTFRVIGKVIRVIDNKTESISLNRKTVIGCLPDQALRQLTPIFQSAEMQELRLALFEWEIPGPVIQVLPVAIFI